MGSLLCCWHVCHAVRALDLARKEGQSNILYVIRMGHNPVPERMIGLSRVFLLRGVSQAPTGEHKEQRKSNISRNTSRLFCR